MQHQTTEAKKNFLKQQWIPLLRGLSATDAPRWGLMNPQQMVEHMGQAFRMAAGLIPVSETVLSSDQVTAMRTFLFSEKPFRENTRNPLMADTPPLPYFPDYETALQKLEKAIEQCFYAFEQEPEKITINPFFGPLNFEGQIQLLYKHALHHLRQFGIVVPPSHADSPAGVL